MQHPDEVTATLFADLVIADGKVLNIERCLVELLACRLAPKSRERHLELFQNKLSQLTLEDSAKANAGSPIMSALNDFERLEMLAKLWRIALCDGELHPDEERLIYDYIDKHDIPRKVAAKIEQAVSTAT